MTPRGTTFELENLGEFEMEIKNILEHESGAQIRLIHEKNQKPKISCYSTFNCKISGKQNTKPTLYFSFPDILFRSLKVHLHESFSFYYKLGLAKEAHLSI
jgi:hypothetical protein